jgi:hypothetical protein
MSKYGYILCLCVILSMLIITSVAKEECKVCEPMVDTVKIEGFTKVVEQ